MKCGLSAAANAGKKKQMRPKDHNNKKRRMRTPPTL
jgi:hypothetical protein